MATTSSSRRRHLRLVPDLSTEPVDHGSLCIDCDSCQLQDSHHCDDCLVSYLVGHEAGEPVILDEEEQQAVELLTDAGLVPPSRFAERVDSA